MSLSGIDEELGLWNPYSRIVCFSMYLYSIEFGMPPLYAELNRVCRDMDLSQVRTLGPFALVFKYIGIFAQYYRKIDDKIKVG